MYILYNKTLKYYINKFRKITNSILLLKVILECLRIVLPQEIE